MRVRDYYTNGEIFIAWVKKKLGIQSPSAIWCSDGKYKYDYDFIMNAKLRDDCRPFLIAYEL